MYYSMAGGYIIKAKELNRHPSLKSISDVELGQRAAHLGGSVDDRNSAIKDNLHELLAPALRVCVDVTTETLQTYQTARLHILYGLDETADSNLTGEQTINICHTCDLMCYDC